MPWQKQIIVLLGQVLFPSAQNQDSGGYVTVGIAVDGKPYKQATALGAFAIAASAGACC